MAVPNLRDFLKSIKDRALNDPRVKQIRSIKCEGSAVRTPWPLSAVKEKDLTFLSFCDKDGLPGNTHIVLKSGFMWNDETFAEMDAENPGPRGTPKGQSTTLILPWDGFQEFFKHISDSYPTEEQMAQIEKKREKLSRTKMKQDPNDPNHFYAEEGAGGKLGD